MFTKTILALALTLATASGVWAATKQHSNNVGFDVYDSRGMYVGSDPDARIRGDLLRSRVSE
jgi:hypothetical protein